MSHLVAIILGFVEGATEFIPISSTGHLIIVRKLLGLDMEGSLAFDAVLQFSASCAIVVYFWSDIKVLFRTFISIIQGNVVLNKDRVLFWAVLAGTIPAIIFGLLFESYMDTIFRNVHLVAVTLIIGSFMFWLAQTLSKKDKDLTLGRGIMIGFFQCLALIPGISRSGATISGGLFLGLTQEEAVRFSFVLSLPILFGAGLKKLFDVRLDLLDTGFGSPLLLGSLTAFLVGLLSISFLIKYLKNHNLNIFIFYRIALSIAIFTLF